MKFSVKKLAVILLMLSILLTGCAKGDSQADSDNSEGNTESESLTESVEDTDTDETEESDTEKSEEAKLLNLGEYSLVRGYDETNDVLAVISEFYFKLIDEYDIEPDFYVDEDVKPSGKEIIFGETNRRADKNHRYSDFSIEYEDGNI